MRRVEIHLNVDTMEIRHHFMRDGDETFRFHSGFSREDSVNGWKQVRGIGAGTDQEIEREKAEIVQSTKWYWEDLLQRCAETRIVQGGNHYVAHPVETGIGFGGKKYRINWLNKDLAPTVCTLSGQGRIPAWMRDRMPENATISVLQ